MASEALLPVSAAAVGGTFADADGCGESLNEAESDALVFGADLAVGKRSFEEDVFGDKASWTSS